MDKSICGLPPLELWVCFKGNIIFVSSCFYSSYGAYTYSRQGEYFKIASHGQLQCQDKYLAKKGFQVTAFDLSQKAINIAINKASKDNVVVNWLCADILCLPNLSQYDLIFDRGCYHHIRYWLLYSAVELPPRAGRAAFFRC